ncbi:hypothetical protein HC031_15215 [Planosporangium thailandense]|uniref:Uncharacterized protein n=1 Tax=Planosporangium thailandense TaxID=765197 RepID=A0ABX0Y0C9_9ACTN|nr:hypothetical protein [Planosporangium thailandense]NJC71050.1 hypothetical protein [Planosporangium thailandense]
MALFRRRKLPTEQRPKLEGDERIVAWAPTGQDVVVLTTYGIWLPGAQERLGWHEVHKATWSGRQLGLVPAGEVGAGEGYVIVADRPAVVHTLLEPDQVPAQVHARVTKSIAYTQHHPLPGGGGVRVVARRVPGVNGLRWTVRYDEGVDPGGPEIATLTAELVEYGRSSL